MANFSVEVIDGALYCEITPESLGLKTETSSQKIPINYGTAVWESIGANFLSAARAVCPIDTGFLYNNIEFQADEGGVEMLSGADYSVYQEYGTSKMPPQPYFESSIQAALEQAMPTFEYIEQQYESVDAKLKALMRGIGGNIPALKRQLSQIDAAISSFTGMIKLMAQLGINRTLDLAYLYQLRQTIVQRIQYLQYLEQQKKTAEMARGKGQAAATLHQFARMFGQIIGTLISSIITPYFNTIWEGTESSHNSSLRSKGSVSR